MKKNEAKCYSNINQLQNNYKKFTYMNSKFNTMTKFNFSRNPLSKRNNKTSSNFNLYKYSQSSHNNSKDISNKNEEIYKNNNNSISHRKTILIKSLQNEKNLLRSESAKDIKSIVYSSKTCDVKNNSNKEIRWFNKTQIKERKTDYIKYKFLLEQKNLFKRLFQQEDFGFFSNSSKKINPYLRKNKRYLFDEDKLKKNCSEKDLKDNSLKNGNDNFSISSIKDIKNSNKKKNIFRINNYSSIKIKKYNVPNILKNSNIFLFDFKDNIRSKKNKLFEELKEIKKSIDHQEHRENKEHKESNGQEKIIDDNYNEYLKGISSSETNNCKIEEKNFTIKKPNVLNKRLKPLNNNLSLNENSEIYQYIQRLNKYNYSSIIIKNNKKLHELKKLIIERRKNLDDFSKSINKSIVIENHFSRKKQFCL